MHQARNLIAEMADIVLTLNIKAIELARLTGMTVTTVLSKKEEINDYFTKFFLDNGRLVLTEHAELLSQAVKEACREEDKEDRIRRLSQLFITRGLEGRHDKEFIIKFKDAFVKELSNRDDWFKPDGSYHFAVLNKVYNVMYMEFLHQVKTS